LWWLWNACLFTATTINAVMIPYGIGFEQDYALHSLIIASFVVYLIDIPIRIRTGITKTSRITADTHLIF
jgi:hypothetical protein